MAFKLKSGNKVNFKEMGSSPFHQTAGSELTAEGTTTIGDLTDETRDENEEARKLKLKQHQDKANKRTKTVSTKYKGESTIEPTDTTDDKYKATGDYQEPEKWYDKKSFKESGIGHIVDAFRSIGRGIKNKKAKKAAKVAEAREAVGSGTETLKQAKLVTRANKKADKQAKKDIKKAKRDKKKLAKYRKKNPVRGKEAINLVTGGGNKSLEPNV